MRPRFTQAPPAPAILLGWILVYGRDRATGTFPCRAPLRRLEGDFQMIEHVGKPPESPGSFVTRRLVFETGITHSQAVELVALLGAHAWSSLVREARLLRLGSA